MRLFMIEPDSREDNYLMMCVTFVRPVGPSGVGLTEAEVLVRPGVLLSYRQFQSAVLAQTGELFRDPEVEALTGEKIRNKWRDKIQACLVEQPTDSDEEEQPTDGDEEGHSDDE